MDIWQKKKKKQQLKKPHLFPCVKIRCSEKLESKNKTDASFCAGVS